MFFDEKKIIWMGLKAPMVIVMIKERGILSRRVYKNKRPFENRETLKSCIKQYWNEIPSETLRKRIASIQKKCLEVLQEKVNKCKYWIVYNFAVKYKFSKLSYSYFYKHIFRYNFLNFFRWKVVIKCIQLPSDFGTTCSFGEEFVQ